MRKTALLLYNCLHVSTFFLSALQVAVTSGTVFFTVNVLFFKHCTIKLIQYTLNSRLIRFSSIRILSNIQEHDSQMDKGGRSQLIQDHSCHPELTKHSNCLCYLWSKHGDGLCKLPLPRR